MSDVKMGDLPNMDMGECSDWILENQYDYELVKKSDIDDAEELATSQVEAIAKLKAELVSCANTIDSLVKSGHISHHPQVELDAMTDGMRTIAATKE